MRIAVVSIALILALCSQASAEETAPGTPPAEGQRYPALRLPTIDGAQTIDLRALRGTPVLLIEFASW